ncbi:UPF0057 membrane protein [Tanacetum coccineum]
MSSGCALLCEIVFALLLPPLGVCLRYGCCTVEFLICLLLTLLGYLPGIIYAIYEAIEAGESLIDEVVRDLSLSTMVHESWRAEIWYNPACVSPLQHSAEL